ncbi:hypothetical protein F2Q69_00022035 [Brassica cretica]|uniref:Uncharacterized protein n=1 Tax=Brassica cretica TaxID=69181 RepID=A0A8S9PZF2_BRACR|nr:hypothetical protein F2Q69_00022035 [Brassica cretica]
MQAWNVQSTNEYAPHRSTTTLVRRSIFDRYRPADVDRYFSPNIDRYMVATLILVRDKKGDPRDQEGHLRNAAEGRAEVEEDVNFIGGTGFQRKLDGSYWCRSTPDLEHRSTNFNQNRSTGFPEHRSITPTESTASCKAVRIVTHEEFAARHPHLPSPVYVKIDRHTMPTIDRQREIAIDRQPPAPIDRRAPLTYRVQMPKIDVARLNALRPQPKPSDNPQEDTSPHSDNAAEPMEVGKFPMGRTLRKRKGKVAKHLKREANEKEMESFQKGVFRILLEKPFEDAYFNHRLLMFFKRPEKLKRTLGECSVSQRKDEEEDYTEEEE